MRALLVIVVVGVAARAYVAWPGRGAVAWTGLTTAAIKIPRKVPAEQRRALIAGCNAAR